MRHLIGFLCVCALGLMPLIGCETADDGGTGGTAGAGGSAGGGGSAGDGGSGGAMEQEFPCTEQGILDAIAEGGGPHTFACEGDQRVVTSERIEIDNDVILDGQGKLTVDGDQHHTVFGVGGTTTAELRNFIITGATNGAAIASGGALTLRGSHGVWERRTRYQQPLLRLHRRAHSGEQHRFGEMGRLASLTAAQRQSRTALCRGTWVEVLKTPFSMAAL